MQYRKDIQILRGLSVLWVVLYHLQMVGINSGFLGVDVFFVISGYLMTLIYNSTKKGEFFAKRARRLLPAYFVVVLITLIFCIILTVPSDYNETANQGLFAATFTSNIGYWFQNSYFDNAIFKPLQHLWSLGVEIQFYLLVPVIFWILKKFKITYWPLLLGSIAACFVVIGISPKTSFYWLPFRLWEFLIGYGVATYWKAGKDQMGKQPLFKWLSVLALIVLVGIPLFNINGSATNFVSGQPGLGALLVCLATGIVLALGMLKSIESSPFAAIFEKLGLYSYSIYLVHFPVIVLFLYQPFSGTILKGGSLGQDLLLILIIGCLSVALYHIVETPLRSYKHTPRLLFAGFITVFIVGQSGTLIQKATIPTTEMVIYQALTDRTEYRCGKLPRLIDPTAISCEITGYLPNPSHRVLFVGDSHADSMKTSFAAVAQSKNVSVRFMIENIPLLPPGIDPQGLIAEALSKHVDAIVLHYAVGNMNAQTVAQLVSIAKAHGIYVSFILPVPTWPESIPLALWNNLKRGEPLPVMTNVDYQKANQALIDGLATITDSNFRVYPVVDLFCPGICRMVDDGGKPLYFDAGHLTLTGGEVLQGVIEKLLTDLPLAI